MPEMGHVKKLVMEHLPELAKAFQEIDSRLRLKGEVSVVEDSSRGVWVITLGTVLAPVSFRLPMDAQENKKERMVVSLAPLLWEKLIEAARLVAKNNPAGVG